MEWNSKANKQNQTTQTLKRKNSKLFQKSNKHSSSDSTQVKCFLQRELYSYNVKAANWIFRSQKKYHGSTACT